MENSPTYSQMSPLFLENRLTDFYKKKSASPSFEAYYPPPPSQLYDSSQFIVILQPSPMPLVMGVAFGHISLKLRNVGFMPWAVSLNG